MRRSTGRPASLTARRAASTAKSIGSTKSFPRWVTSPTPTTTGVRASTNIGIGIRSGPRG
ncbi:Uncharacterised protein [Mycobacteroides abscessus subsp. abscessus]|nr:Uncharacterised protein [Mycobacteroides abscessus subsp. abscessus]